MIDFSGSSQSQGGDSQDDPIQEMIRRAVAASRGNDAAFQPRAPEGTLSIQETADRPSFGEKIGAKTPATTPRPAVEQPVPARVVTQPRPSITPPGATGILVPVTRDSTPSPSFGQKIGAKTAVQPAANPAPTAPSISSIIPQSAPPAALTAGLDRKPLPSGLPSALAEQQKYATPLDPKAVDPTTGKPIYKMGWGQRLAGVAANFASGMAGRGPVSYIGPGATNQRFTREDDLRKANLEKANLNVAGQEKQDTTNLNLEKLAQRQAYESDMGASRKETAEARMATSAAQQETADIKDQLAQAKIAQGPQEPKTESEIALALQTAQLKGDKMGTLKYKGALAELAKQKQAGRAPKDTTAGDISKAIQVAEFRSRRLADLDKEQDKERQQRYAELDKNEFDPDKIATKKTQVDQEIQTKYAPKAQDIHDQADQMLGLTKAGAKLTSSAGKVPPKPTTAPPAGKVWVFDKRTGKRGAIPSGQLGIATRGTNAQYGAW
jgi:hypothetical protein